MASLKELRGRITSVKSTRKITNAMKMVAASKLRRAQMNALASRPYADTMRSMMGELASAIDLKNNPSLPKLCTGTGKDNVHLLIVLTSDRGLVGGFNSNILRIVQHHINELRNQGKTVKIIAVGTKGSDIFTRSMPDAMVETYPSSGESDGITFKYAKKIAKKVIELVNKEEVDCCSLFTSRFVNAMTQIPEKHELVPLSSGDNDNKKDESKTASDATYIFEPDDAELLGKILPRNLEIQIFSALLESAAGEQGSRMTAMDNSSRNANKFIDTLSLTYNRSRQASITSELIEIISGAEAV